MRILPPPPVMSEAFTFTATSTATFVYIAFPLCGLMAIRMPLSHLISVFLTRYMGYRCHQTSNDAGLVGAPRQSVPPTVRLPFVMSPTSPNDFHEPPPTYFGAHRGPGWESEWTAGELG